MNAAVYLRKSRADGDDVTIEDTLRKHKEILLDFASRQPDMTIYGLYEEVVSGDSLYARPQMLRLLEDADHGLFDSVLCMDIDRLGRGDMSDQGIILNNFKINGVKIITPRGVYDPNNERDEDALELETLKARWEYKSITRRLRNGTIKSVKDGCCLWNAPYGYVNVKKNRRPTLEINEEEAKIVRMIFDMYANSDMGAQTIAYTVNAMGAHPHRADHFNRTSIVSMIKNQTYIGKIVFNKKIYAKKGTGENKRQIVTYNKPEDWTVVDGLHEPIIDEFTFFKANQKLKSRYHKPYNDGNIENPLAGLVKCSVCGYNLQRRPYPASRKYQSDQLLCATKGCCCASRLDYVEEAILDNVNKKLEELRILKKTKLYSDSEHFIAIVSGIDKELSTLEKQRGKLHDLLERGVYTVDVFMERRESIAERVTKITEQKKEVLAKMKKQSPEALDETIKKFENVLELYHSSSAPDKNRLLKQIISRCTYFKAKKSPPKQFMISVDYKDV